MFPVVAVTGGVAVGVGVAVGGVVALAVYQTGY